LSNKCYVGNGGLSIRKISTFISIQELLLKNKIFSPSINEDLIISYLGSVDSLNIPCDLSFVNSIFSEETSNLFSSIPDIYGFHALNKYNPHLESLIYSKFSFYDKNF
jgi:hypothetical protein